MHKSRFLLTAAAAAVAAILALGCSPGSGESDGASDGGADSGTPDSGPFMPDQVCPGDPDCLTGTGGLMAAAVARTITPDWPYETWTDTEGDAEFDPNVDPWDDVDGDGELDGIWMAGFGEGRPANGVMDDIWARTMVLRSGDTTIAITALDVVGYFYDEVQLIRDALPASLGVDLVLVSATHVHEAPDSIGIWGPELNVTGVDPRFMEKIRAAVVDNITDAVAALEPADITYASAVTEHPTRSYEPYVGDSRHPTILDPTITLMQLTRESDSTTIGTIVHWTAHPEYLGSRNLLLSSDIAGYIRDYVTDGIDDAWTGAAGGPIPGIGGVTLFVNGTVGTQVGPGRVVAITPDESMEFSSASVEKTMYAARGVAEFALDALANNSTMEDSADLTLRRKAFRTHIENRGYHLFLLFGVLDRTVYNWAPGAPIVAPDFPETDTEVVYLRIGRAEVITNPGELSTELFTGGYDGSMTGPWPLIEAGLANPPDLSLAPGPPYLRDLMTADYRMCWGLTQDMLGYILPAYEFTLHPQSEYIEEAEGDHYEETNSIGPNAEEDIVGTMRDLLLWTPSTK